MLTEGEENILNICFAKSLIQEDAIAASKSIEIMALDTKLPLVFDLMSKWPDSRLEEAVLWLSRNKVPPQMMELALPAIISRSFNLNPNSAISLVANLPPGRVSDSLYSQLSNLLYDKDKETAKSWIEALAPGAAQETAIEAYCMRAFDKDPEKSLDDLGRFVVGDIASSKIREKIVSVWAAQNPKAAIDWLDKSGDLGNDARMNLHESIMQSWAVASPTELMRYIDNEPNLVLTDSVAAQLIDSMSAKGSYSDAANWMIVKNRESPARVSTLTSRWIRDDSIAASKWVSGLPRGEIYDAGAIAIIEAIGADDRQMASNWAMGISNDKKRDAILSDLKKK